MGATAHGASGRRCGPHPVNAVAPSHRTAARSATPALISGAAVARGACGRRPFLLPRSSRLTSLLGGTTAPGRRDPLRGTGQVAAVVRRHPARLALLVQASRRPIQAARGFAGGNTSPDPPAHSSRPTVVPRPPLFRMVDGSNTVQRGPQHYLGFTPWPFTRAGVPATGCRWARSSAAMPLAVRAAASGKTANRLIGVTTLPSAGPIAVPATTGR